MTPSMLLDAFFLHALLKEAVKKGNRLQLPHHGEQASRLIGPLNLRNIQTAGVGLHQWGHRCDACHVRIVESETGLHSEFRSSSGILRASGSNFDVTAKAILLTSYFFLPGILSAAVTDGVTLGHPCCNEHDCKEPLQKIYDEFCLFHDTHNTMCCVKGCSSPRKEGFRTCEAVEHRMEEERRSSMSKKRRIKKRSQLSGVGDAIESSRGRLEGRSGARKLPGAFGRRWTHNEQLMVRPCGVVIGRATFYASESLGAVRVRCVHSLLCVV